MRKSILLLNVLFVLDPKASMMQYHGAMALHSWNAKVTGLRGEASVGAEGLPSAHGKLEIDVRSIDTFVGKRNADMYRILEAEKYPEMVFNLKSAEPLPNVTEDGRQIEALAPGESKCALHGQLVLRGRAAPVEGTGMCRDRGAQGWEIEGDAPVDMRSFDITPPHALFFSMAPVVNVKYRLFFRPRGSAHAPKDRDE